MQRRLYQVLLNIGRREFFNSKSFLNEVNDFLIPSTTRNLQRTFTRALGSVRESIVDIDETDEEIYHKVFTQVVKDLVSFGEVDPEARDASRWYKRGALLKEHADCRQKCSEFRDIRDFNIKLTVSEYNLQQTRVYRTSPVDITLQSYRYLLGDRVTSDGLLKAGVLGWCTELFRTSINLADDIMDRSVTRCGQPCWYLQPEVKLMAINDALHMTGSIFVLLNKYLKDHPCYTHIVDLFHEIHYKSITGQTLDALTSPTDRVDFTNYTMARYETVVKYKAAFHTFSLPVTSAMYLAGIYDKKTHEAARDILIKMGEYDQIKNDYVDCFGDSSLSGKIGNDIESNKCSWLVVQALQRVTPEQRTILENNYARKEAHCVSEVRRLYDQLNLKQLYREYEQHSYQQLTKLIHQLCGAPGQKNTSGLPREIFTAFLTATHGEK